MTGTPIQEATTLADLVGRAGTLNGRRLGAHPCYAAFLEHAQQSGAWLSAWSDDGER